MAVKWLLVKVINFIIEINFLRDIINIGNGLMNMVKVVLANNAIFIHTLTLRYISNYKQSIFLFRRIHLGFILKLNTIGNLLIYQFYLYRIKMFIDIVVVL